MLKKLLEIINNNEKSITVSENSTSTKLNDLGFDSIDFVYIIVRIEDEFHLTIPDEMLSIEALDTVDKIIDSITRLVRLDDMV